MKEYSLEQQATEQQHFEIINFFGQRRPENLLQFQKAFLNSQCEKVCAATLAKYVFEKWRNVRPKLQVSQQKWAFAKYHYRMTKLRSVLAAMANHSRQVRQQSCISMWVSQTHADNRLKAVFVAIRDYAEVKREHRKMCERFSLKRTKQTQTEILQAWSKHSARMSQLTTLADSFAERSSQQLGIKFLTSMRNLTAKNNTNQSIVDSFDSRRSRAICLQAIRILHGYASSQRERRQ